MSRRTRGVLGAVVAILLLWWVLRDISPSAVLAELRSANPWWMTAAVVLATFSFVLRAIRWRVLLQPGNAGTDFGVRFGATCTGFAANNLFPARVGEVVRAYVLTRVGGVPFGASVGSLVVERVLDGLVLLSFLVVPVLLPGFPLGDDGTGAFVRRVAIGGSAVFLAGFVVLWAAALRPDRALELWRHTIGRILPERIEGPLDRGVAMFVGGLGSLARPRLLAEALAWSYVVWTCIALSYWTGFLAFEIRGPGLLGAAFVQSVVGFAVALPSTPGFFGLFEAGARIGLRPWGVPDAVIVGFATSYHILTFIPVTVLGLWYARRVGVRWNELRSRGRTAAAAPSGDPGGGPASEPTRRRAPLRRPPDP